MQDLRLAFRSLRATPIVTAVAVLSLALGIGANTAIFSLLNSLMLRTLPVVEPQQLAIISDARAIRGGFTAGWTYAVWDQIRQRARPFDGAAAWMFERFNLAEGDGETVPLEGLYASGGYFAALGVPALVGRTFTPADDRPEGGNDGPVAVISYALWQRRFGGSDRVVGTRLVLEHTPFTIIGVTPAWFFGADVGRSFDVALPLSAEPLIRGADSRIGPQRVFYGLTVLLRLKPGQSIEQANAIVRGMQPQVREAAMPPALPALAQKEFLTDAFTIVPGALGTSRLRTRYERPLVVIFVVVLLVLLIACANIANLQLARATARRHEVSVRLALGAARSRLARQWLVESLLLAGIGAALGLLFASWFSLVLVAQLSTTVNRVYLDLSLDWRVMAFTAAATIGTALLFGTLPAFTAARVSPMEALKEQARSTPSEARLTLSNGLVIAQVTLSLVIVVAAGLFVRTFVKLATQPLGFDSNRILLVNVNVARTRVGAADRLAFFHRLARETGGVPGVANATASLTTPVVGVSMVAVVRLPGDPPSLQVMNNGRLGDRSSYTNFVAPAFFDTYGIPMRAGRDFAGRDVKESAPVIIVNEAFVRKFLKDRTPLGATVHFEYGRGAPVGKTVVGVVADAVDRSLRSIDPIVYAPLAQFDFPGPTGADVTLSLRSSAGSPLQLARSVGATLTAIDEDLAFSFRPLPDQIHASLTQERVIAMLAGFFAALALFLAALGLYGVTAYAVSRRRIEIGIRMALGAAPAGVVRLVLSRVTVLVGVGVVAGAAISLWASAFVVPMLYGLTARDPLTLTGSAITLVVVGAVAAWIPAWRASRIDPAQVLRES